LMGVFTINNLGLRVDFDDSLKQLFNEVTMKGQIPQSSNLFDPDFINKFESGVKKAINLLPQLHGVEMELGTKDKPMTEEEYQKLMQNIQ